MGSGWSAAVVREHWHDRRQEHSSGNRSENKSSACDRQLQSCARDAVCTDVGLEVAVWSENQSSEVRQAAALALGELGEHAASAVPALTKCIAHDDEGVRRGGS